jgi:ribonuclease P protein component
VAFALGRALGPAVVRNRLRRRLRAICRQLDQQGRMPGGLLLIGANPSATELTFVQLEAEVRSMITSIRPPSAPIGTMPTTAGPSG